MESIDDNTHFLIATREKALADYMARQMSFSNREELLNYLVESMRIDANDIDALKPDLMMQIASLYQNKNVDLLCKILQEIKAPEALERMLARYELNSLADYKNAIKEIVQEIALLGLWRAKFFEKAAFYGGTALRILYQLDRFSEDLDFSLLSPAPAFDLKDYEKAIQQELAGFGIYCRSREETKIKIQFCGLCLYQNQYDSASNLDRDAGA